MTAYDAAADLRDRYPGWDVIWRPTMETPEVICVETQIIVIGNTRSEPNVALAHAIAHLDLHQDAVGTYSEDEEDQARFLADIRLDQHNEWLGSR